MKEGITDFYKLLCHWFIFKERVPKLVACETNIDEAISVDALYFEVSLGPENAVLIADPLMVSEAGSIITLLLCPGWDDVMTILVSKYGLQSLTMIDGEFCDVSEENIIKLAELANDKHKEYL